MARAPTRFKSPWDQDKLFLHVFGSWNVTAIAKVVRAHPNIYKVRPYRVEKTLAQMCLRHLKYSDQPPKSLRHHRRDIPVIAITCLNDANKQIVLPIEGHNRILQRYTDGCSSVDLIVLNKETSDTWRLR